MVDWSRRDGGVAGRPENPISSLAPLDRGADEFDPESFEAAVMVSDRAANAWLVGESPRAGDAVSSAFFEDDIGDVGADDDPVWLPLLTTDDHTLVGAYMLARRFPAGATESLDHWPTSELRHLLDNARLWKVAEARRAVERANSDRRLNELSQRHAESRALLERIYRDQAMALLARDADKSLILLTAREARRSASGNHTAGNQGLELEKQLRQVSADRGFAMGPPHWDSASKRLLIDLYHHAAEAWWNSGEASGLVAVPPNGKVLESKRAYRALYPFQRAAINAAHVNRQNDAANTGRTRRDDVGGSTARAPELDSSAISRPRQCAELAADRLLEEAELLVHPQAPADSTPPTPPAQLIAVPSPPTGDAPKPASPTRLPTGQTKHAAMPNARKGFKLTLWVSPTTELGLADAHGLLQLDGADPVPFCRLKDVPNPLARALQEAYVAVEQVRAKPPRMPAPASGTPPAPSALRSPAAPGVAQPSGNMAPHADSLAPLKTPKSTAQPSLF